MSFGKLKGEKYRVGQRDFLEFVDENRPLISRAESSRIEWPTFPARAYARAIRWAAAATSSQRCLTSGCQNWWRRSSLARYPTEITWLCHYSYINLSYLNYFDTSWTNLCFVWSDFIKWLLIWKIIKMVTFWWVRSVRHQLWHPLVSQTPCFRLLWGREEEKPRGGENMG